MKVYLALLLFSALVTYIATPVMRHIGFRIGAVAAVRDRDVHKVPTARLGGVAIFLGIAAAIALANAIPFLQPVFDNSGAAWAVMGGAGLVCVIGVIDDIVDLDWMAKLAGQVFAAWIMAWGGVQLVTVPIAGLTIASSPVSLLATMLIVVVAINAINFVDGLDGLAAGMMAIGGSAFALYTYVIQRDASPGDYSSLATLILAALVGACIGFLPHNLHPARVFMGDSGSMVLGLTMAGAAIIVTGQIDPEVVSARERLPAFVPIILPIMVVAVPLLDMALAIVTRTVRGQSPWSADSHHLHHRLMDFGHSHRWAVSVLYIWTAALSFGAVSLVFVRGRYAALLMGVGIVIAAVVTYSPRFRTRVTRVLDWAGQRGPDEEVDEPGDAAEDVGTSRVAGRGKEAG
ncbi:MAG: undecaprenyl/decaprenyl-phosphate alpha-N-acetylglucosaminyl 1-phosphate transferase [Demequinaceae bacterium]|nr:undecaprenyl/decaprenyl-phosphate alpha-N-acetylglucosaminyl 1-phosphate transferase [Demequinaceae bacterium]